MFTCHTRFFYTLFTPLAVHTACLQLTLPEDEMKAEQTPLLPAAPETPAFSAMQQVVPAPPLPSLPTTEQLAGSMVLSTEANDVKVG